MVAVGISCHRYSGFNLRNPVPNLSRIPSAHGRNLCIELERVGARPWRPRTAIRRLYDLPTLATAAHALAIGGARPALSTHQRKRRRYDCRCRQGWETAL